MVENVVKNLLFDAVFGLKVRVDIVVNNKPLSFIVGKELSSLELVDEVGFLSDQLTLKFTPGFIRPRAGDKIEVFINSIDYGVFLVDESIKTKSALTVKAKSANFKDSLKEKKYRSFEKIKVCELIAKIAKEHNLEYKCNIKGFINHLGQNYESDINLLVKLAKDFNATFNIKKNKILFLDKEDTSKLPLFVLSYSQVSDFSIKSSIKPLYNSCKAIWRDTKENKDKSIVIGKEKPELLLKGVFKSEAEARERALAALKNITQGTKKGSITVYGQEIRAGARLRLVGFFEDDGEYKIKKVTHKISKSYTINIDFET